MPIINSYFSNSITATPNTGGGTIEGGNFNNAPYPYSLTTFIELPANEKYLLIPKRSESREVTLSFSTPVELFFGNDEIPFKTLSVLEKFRDNQLGVNLWVKALEANCQCLVVVRSMNPIDYIGDDMPAELIIRPLIQTGELYSMPPIVPTTTGEENLSRILDSNNGAVTGTKVWAIDQFNDGKEYIFTINPNGVINISIPVRVMLVKVEDVMKCLASFDASDNGELDQLTVSEELIGWIKARSYYTEVDLNQATTFKLKPTRTRYILAFDAGNPDTEGYTDTVISSYQKNTTDIYQGGTFTFLGF